MGANGKKKLKNEEQLNDSIFRIQWIETEII